MPDPTVVVGASLAGVRTAQALRRRGYDNRIVLIGAESHLPYDRPPLSKGFLLGRTEVGGLTLLDETALAGLDIELRPSTRAVGLDIEGRCLGLQTERGGPEAMRYTDLVIATGSRPRQLPGPPGVGVLHTIEDARAVRAGLQAGANVVVVGGGFVGCEVASAARAFGLSVTVVDPLPALMVRGLGPVLGQVLGRRHAEQGVRLRLGRTVRGFSGRDRVEAVHLDDGSVLPADLVVVGIGADPAVEWLSDSGLSLARGVGCDPTLRAAPGVYAVGDVATWTDSGVRRRAEHWTNATDQAMTVAETMTGGSSPFRPLPYVWSDQLGTTVQIWGEVGAADELVYLTGGPDQDEFLAVTGAAGRLRSVVALGCRRDAIRLSRQLRAGAAWQPRVGPVLE